MSRAALDRAGQQAIDWMVRLRSGQADPQLQAGLAAWLARDPANAQAWEHLQLRLGGAYDTLRSLEPRAPGQAREVLLQPGTSRRQVLRGLAGFGVLAGGLWLGAQSTPGQMLLADKRTGTGERRQFSLADGSQLSLNANSAVDVRFEAGQRLLYLRAGELIVQVAPDPNRPFRVRTGQGEIRALGTRFLVRQEAEATRVVVLEHAVRASLADGTSRDVQQGQAALLHAGRIEALSSDESHRGDWLQGRLIVLDEPLLAVVDALRPYRRGIIRVAPQIRQLRVQGVFPLDEPDRALTALAETLPITVEHYGPWLTLLGPRR